MLGIIGNEVMRLFTHQSVVNENGKEGREVSKKYQIMQYLLKAKIEEGGVKKDVTWQNVPCKTNRETKTTFLAKPN